MSSLSRETLAAALKEIVRIRTGFVPGPAELADAPILSHWTAETLPGGGLYLVGEVSGHPRTADGWCTTSVILAIDVRAGWVRTINRYYRLGPSLGQSLQ
jgi:hypothetical protein